MSRGWLLLWIFHTFAVDLCPQRSELFNSLTASWCPRFTEHREDEITLPQSVCILRKTVAVSAVPIEKLKLTQWTSQQRESLVFVTLTGNNIHSQHVILRITIKNFTFMTWLPRKSLAYVEIQPVWTDRLYQLLITTSDLEKTIISENYT